MFYDNGTVNDKKYCLFTHLFHDFLLKNNRFTAQESWSEDFWVELFFLKKANSAEIKLSKIVSSVEAVSICYFSIILLRYSDG